MFPFSNEDYPLDPDLIFDGYISTEVKKFSYQNCIEVTMKGVFIFSISVDTNCLPPDYSDSMVLLTRVLVHVTETQNEQKKILEDIIRYPTLSQSTRMSV